MEKNFILSAESTIDLPYSYAEERGIPILFYTYTVGEKVYTDDMQRDPVALPRFYGLIEEGKLPATSQINVLEYEAFFEEQLKKGDLLHLAFGTGMTPSFYNAEKAAENLRERYPERKIFVVDSLASSSGYGLLLDAAADLRDQGKSMEEIVRWIEANRNRVHHQFFCTDLKMFKRSGRVSGAAATVATILGICPLMRLDDRGKIIAYDKVRGKKRAVAATVNEMEKHAAGGKDYDGKCFLSYSNCPEEAKATLALLEERFPKLRGKIRFGRIGTIIASHCGPGTVAVFFFGDERKPDASAK